MRLFVSFLSGLLFSMGLIISGMTYPENIVGFLDFFGDWKPALALVMVGAAGVYALLYPFVRRRKKPILANKFDIPKSKKLDVPLIVGSAAFGIGWGLSGLCPGPAFVSLGSGTRDVLIFVGSMVLGIYLHALANRSQPSSSSSSDDICG